MILGFITLILCQLAGDIVAGYFGIPVPGAVFGIVFVFIFLLIRGAVPKSLKKTSSSLLDYLALFYVPAGVGLMRYLDLLKKEWLIVLLALLLSSAITVAVTSVIMQKLIGVKSGD
ncbi:MAG: CidA/LrgA family protein [Gammaproteobacteria bacterium]|nr:MAG: CidA/LrgA family protein [Gammaproteobacteria bacterium]